MKNYEEIYNEVKSRLSEKRFYHSVCTMQRAEEYAKIYGEDEEKIKLIAIAHDIAKQLKPEEVEKLVKKYNIKLDDMEKENIALSHSKIGAEICKNEFGFDENMANAIAFHTTGRENMTILEKIIFVADATGSDRNFEDTQDVNQLAKNNLDEAMIKILIETIKDIVENKKTMHLDTIRTYNYYIDKNQ